MHRLFLFIIFFVSTAAHAANFETQLSSKEVPINQTFTLSLILQDGKPISEPDISMLSKDFEVLGSSRYSSTNIINLEATTTQKWIYTLKGKREGFMSLGPFKIMTKDGKLEADAVSVKIVAAKARPSKDQGSGIFMETELSKKNPYKNEPIIYTVKLFTPNNISGLGINDPKIDGASVKSNGSHEVTTEDRGGLTYSVVTWRFTITPHKTGDLNLEPFELSGKYTPSDNRYRSIFDDPLEQFSLGGFGIKTQKPFTVGGKKLVVNVQPLPDGVSTSLIASALTLEEEYDSTSFKVGEPIARKITIHAAGIDDSKLPDIAFQSDSGKYKIYDEPAKGSTQYSGDLISSSKSKSFTIIPQSQGEIVFPEFELEYFNTSIGKLEKATLPAKTIYVKQGEMVVQGDDSRAEVNSPEEPEQELEQSPVQQDFTESKVNLPLIIALVVMSIVALLLLVRARNLKRRLEEGQKEQHKFFKEKKDETPKISLADVKGAANAKELRARLQQFAQDHFGARANSSLQQIVRQLSLTDEERAEFIQLATNIDKAIYMNAEHDIGDLKEGAMKLIQVVEMIGKAKKSNKKKGKLADMNPGV